MTIRSTFFAGLVLSVIPCTGAFADTLFNFSFTGPTISGSGQFTTMAESTPGEYLITGVTGTTNGTTISALEPAPSTLFNNDNLLFYHSATNPTSFDLYGVVYDLSTGAQANLFDLNGQSTEYLYGAKGKGFLLNYAPISVTPAASAVPEPVSLLLLGTGAVGLVGVLRRRLAV